MSLRLELADAKTAILSLSAMTQLVHDVTFGKTGGAFSFNDGKQVCLIVAGGLFVVQGHILGFEAAIMAV